MQPTIQTEQYDSIPHIIRPTLSQQEVWSRNLDFKNWGNYNVWVFRKGQPRWIVTALPQMIVLVAVIMIACWKVTNKGSVGIIENAVLWVTVIGIVGCLVWLQMRDPGIASDCLPVANQDSLRSIDKYCQPCRIYKLKGIKHCQQCNVCITDQLIHSRLFQRCITPLNIHLWFISLIALLTFTVYATYILWFY